MAGSSPAMTVVVGFLTAAAVGMAVAAVTVVVAGMTAAVDMTAVMVDITVMMAMTGVVVTMIVAPSAPLDRRQWGQLHPGVFLVNPRQHPVAGIHEHPRVDPLPQ